MSTLNSGIEKIYTQDPISILIVDDRPENLLTLESIIENGNRKILKADGGNEALRIAIKENIGLIMMDIQMPEIDGIEVARLLRSNNTTRHIPIIFVSAINNSERTCMSGFEAGSVDWLNKPLDVDETRNKVALYEKIFYMRMENSNLKLVLQKQITQFDQFVYIISHDLKAPLRAIDNLTNWIADDLGGKEEDNVNENLALMRSRVHRMRSLLDGVLEFSRCGKYTEAPETLNLEHLAYAIFESLTPFSGFQMKTQSLPSVKMEAGRMYAIFYQLIKNAIIHHPTPGQGLIFISAEKEKDHIIFSVTDNGPGIKPQYFQKVFDIFTTLKSKDDLETTGMGLTIVRKILEDIGERIWVESELTKGTSFKFTLSSKYEIRI